MLEIKITANDAYGIRAELEMMLEVLGGEKSGGDLTVEEAIQIMKENDRASFKEPEVEEEVEEEPAENIAGKMTYWKFDGEYGSSRKGAVIPEGAETFSSKATWEAHQEEGSAQESNFPTEDVEEEVTRDQIIDKMGFLIQSNANNKKDVVALLTRFNAKKFGQVDESDYVEFYTGLLSIEKAGA